MCSTRALSSRQAVRRHPPALTSPFSRRPHSIGDTRTPEARPGWVGRPCTWRVTTLTPFQTRTSQQPSTSDPSWIHSARDGWLWLDLPSRPSRRRLVPGSLGRRPRLQQPTGGVSPSTIRLPDLGRSCNGDAEWFWAATVALTSPRFDCLSRLWRGLEPVICSCGQRAPCRVRVRIRDTGTCTQVRPEAGGGTAMTWLLVIVWILAGGLFAFSFGSSGSPPCG